MEREILTTFALNGTTVTRRIAARKHLIDFLREELGLTGSRVGCEHGVCGACTVRVDGKIVRGCLMLAVQADGRRVDTIEGLSDSGALAELQQAFHRSERAAVRFLHARHADRRAGSGAEAPAGDARGDPRAPFRQLLPLHRLRGDRRRDRGRSRRAPQGGRVMAADHGYIGKSVPRANAKRLLQGRGDLCRRSALSAPCARRFLSQPPCARAHREARSRGRRAPCRASSLPSMAARSPSTASRGSPCSPT